MSEVSQKVRALYERWPYPTRIAAEERQRLVWGPIGLLGLINTRCFGGRRDFREDFSVLVAGCGSGDSAIFLAEQLRGGAGRVTALDFSANALALAQERAKIRGLTNIEFIEASLLDLPELASGKLGPFDYINSGGVLHHLEDPAAGLAALRRVLAPEGAMGIMVYGHYGRAGITAARELIDKLLEGETDPQRRVDLAIEILHSLPDSHLFERIAQLGDERVYDPGGVADMFLHPCEHTYTVPEIYEWIEGAKLSWLSWIENRHAYMPQAFLREPALLAKIEGRSAAEAHALGELISTSLAKHSFYLTHAGREPQEAVLSDDMIPQLWSLRPRMEAVRELREFGRASFGSAEAQLHLQAEPFIADLLEAMDGERSVASLLEKVTKNKSAELEPARAQLTRLVELLSLSNEVLLRAKGLPRALEPHELHAQAFG